MFILNIIYGFGSLLKDSESDTHLILHKTVSLKTKRSAVSFTITVPKFGKDMGTVVNEQSVLQTRETDSLKASAPSAEEG